MFFNRKNFFNYVPDWKRHIPKWSFLRQVGNSYAIKLTILIPLVGYFIIFNDNVVRYLELAKEFSGLSTSEQWTGVSPRLLMIYFGLCALAVGSVIYSARCPTVIKNYGSAASYVGGDGPSIGELALDELESEITGSGDMLYMKQCEALRTHYRRDYGNYTLPEQRELQSRDHHEYHNAILHMHFEYLDELHPWSRKSALIFFTIGFVFLLVPSVMVFLRVLQILIHAPLWRLL